MKIETFQRNIIEYERHLATLYTSEEWERIPPRDRLMYWAFETLNPHILQRPHRLMTSNEHTFRIITGILGSNGAIIGEWKPIERNNKNETIVEEVRAWDIPENQESLCLRIKGMKSITHKSLIFPTTLSESVIQKIETSPIIVGIYGDTSKQTWFVDLDNTLDELGWAYIPLRDEISPLDLLVVSDEYASCLQEIDRVFEHHGWISKACVRGDDRWYWTN